MKILVSFFTDKFSVLREFWKKSAENKKGGAFQGTDKYEKLDLGGFLALINWKNKKILKKVRIETPRGFDLYGNKIYVTKGNQEIVVLDKNLNGLYKFSNPYFNNLHWVKCYKNGLFFACSGLDMVLETNSEGKTKYKWFATDHGFNRDPKGRVRKIKLKKDYRKDKFPTLKQTTHLNSIVYAGKTKYFEETLYVSLFHQGKVLAINKRTGDCKIVMGGLKHPHAIRESGEGYVVSDTENGKVIIVDKNFKGIDKYTLNKSNWIQDCFIMKNKNLLICDSNNNRILELDRSSKKIKEIYNYDPEWKIFSAMECPN